MSRDGSSGVATIPGRPEADSGAVVTVPAVLTLMRLSLERIIRGRRLVVLAVLFLIPAGIALLARHYNPEEDISGGVRELLLFFLIPNALVPFAALMLGSGQIQDEVEEQTLTYLLIRPLPRWLIYVVKAAATALVAAGLTGVFTLITVAAIYLNNPLVREPVTPGFAVRITGLLVLASVAYSALFTALGVFFKRALVLGMAYILAFEGIFANVDFVIRKATVMYYTRVLAERWLGIHNAGWMIDTKDAPTGVQALLTLLVAILLATLVAAVRFTTREWRLKTPEGG
jgi:ABC-2 type transport system permease protein